MEGEHWTGLALVQPTRKREWQLRQGDHVVAELHLPALKRDGEARVGDRELELRVSGLLRPEHVLVDASTGEEVARVRRKQVVLASEQAEWKSLGRGRGLGARRR